MKKNVVYVSVLSVGLFLCVHFSIAEITPSKGNGPVPNGYLDSPNAWAFNWVRQGFTMKIKLNNLGSMGRIVCPPWTPTPNTTPCTNDLGLEYPVGDRIEHLYGGGLWIGGLLDTARAPNTSPPLRLVTTSYEGWSGPFYETFPGVDPSVDRFWTANRFDSVAPPGWEAYWGGGLPFKPISDQDYYVTYRDSHSVAVAQHIPLNLKVIQSSYAWNDPYADAILIIEYKIINMGRKPIDSAYVAFFFEADVGPVNVPSYATHNFTGYYPDLKLAYIHNPLDIGSTPIGVTLLSTARSLDSLRYAFRWFPGPQTPTPDINRYVRMSSGVIDTSEYPSLSDTRFVFSFGPFNIKPSNPPTPTPGVIPDTLKVAVAIVSGKSSSVDSRLIMQRNARRALDIYFNQAIKLPATPPSPPLRVKVGFRRVELDWKWQPGDNVFAPGQDPRIYGRPDPEQNWDKTNVFARRDSCRIANPPPGAPADSGGRNFEAYRLWRSESSERIPPGESWTLLRQYDVGNEPEIACRDSFFFNTGLRYTYVDSNLVRGKTYQYAVTSVSIPNLAQVPLPGGGFEYAVVEELESSRLVAEDKASISGNSTRVDLPFAVSQELGKASVVPNPYRTDRTYTTESGGYEGSSSGWKETYRSVKFINLPEVCTIRIFTLSGELVRTVEHNGAFNPDGSVSSFPRGDSSNDPSFRIDVPLLSESNRAMASGIYIFTVDSKFGNQTGKFVILR